MTSEYAQGKRKIRKYYRMKDAGIKFHGEPQVQPYGTGVTLEDLYGNKIYVNQDPAVQWAGLEST
jgi:hypothetical protein